MPRQRFLTAYIDLPFLEKLLKNKPKDFAAAPDDNWPEVWQNVFRFLQRYARIEVDASLEEIRKKPTLMNVLLGSGQVKHVQFSPGLAERYADPGTAHTDDPFCAFMFEDPRVPVQELRERKGLLFLRYEELEANWLRLFDGHTIDVSREQAFRWADVLPHAKPINAVVIADKYMYSQLGSTSFDENVGALLQEILPRGPIEGRVHLTMVTDLKAALEELGRKPDDLHKFIEKRVQSLRPNLSASVSIAGYHGGQHKDRYVFTNYGMFSSNDSFEFFRRGDLKKQTLITYLPAGSGDSPVMRARLARLSKVCDEPKKYPYSGEILQLAAGDCRNRLFDHLR